MPKRVAKNEPSTSRAVPMNDDSEYEEEDPNQNIDLVVRNFVKYIINYSVNKLPIKRNGELIKNTVPTNQI